MNNRINVDLFKRCYYKSLLPIDKINEFLQLFSESEIEQVTKTLISIFDVTITKNVLLNLETSEDKQSYLRLLQEDYSSPMILDYLIDQFPKSSELISESIDRALLSATTAIK